MAVAGPASQLGLRHHVGEVLRAAVVVLEQADGSIRRAAGNENTAGPIVEMGRGEFVWIGSVGRERLDTLASHQAVVQSRVQIRRQKCLAGVQACFGALHVAIEGARCCRFQFLCAQGRRRAHRERHQQCPKHGPAGFWHRNHYRLTSA